MFASAVRESIPAASSADLADSASPSVLNRAATVHMRLSVADEHCSAGCAAAAGARAALQSLMPIQGKKESKQRAIKSPQASGNTAKGALAALVVPSPELAHIVGSQPLTRGDATKRLW